MDVDDLLRRAGQEWRSTVSAPFEKAQLARDWTVGGGSGMSRRLVPLAAAAVVIAIAVVTATVLRPANSRATHPIAPPPSSGSSPTPSSTRPINAPFAACTLSTLTAPAAAGAYASWHGAHIDPTGRYLVTTLTKPFTLPLPDVVPSKAMLMDLNTGRTTIIPVTDGQAWGVNASGTVIGNIEPTGAGWTYRNGKLSMLPPYHGQPTTPLAIDARGDIIGEVIGKTQIWVTWPADHPGTVRQLLPKNLIANTISDSGLIGGSIGPFDQGRPYVGDGNGTGHTLSTGTDDPQGDLFGISGNYAVGSGPIFGGRFPLVWNLVTGQVTTYANITDGSLDAVSDDGTAVGEVGYGQTTILFPVIAKGGQLHRLPTGHGNSVQVYMTANDVTADGHTIVGTNRTNADGDGPYKQVGLLWHC
jgi:hypothetical protein